MVTRIWHGRTRTEDSDAFRQYMIETGVSDLLKTNGSLGVQIWEREEGNITHMWMVTQWINIECIRSFAGNDVEKAKYYSEDEKFLLELERNVIHCRTFSFSRVRIQSYIRQLQQVFGGGSWNDESFTGKLNAVDEQKAFMQPIPGKHCIAEIVWHCTYWRTVLLKQFQGDNDFRERTLNDQNFLSLESLRQKGWSSLLAEFRQSQEALIALLNTRNDDFLEGEYKEGSTFDYILEGVIHHDIYHLGQIGLLISSVNN